MSNLSDRFSQYGVDLASSQSEYLSWDGSATNYSASGDAFPAPLGGTNAVYSLVTQTDISSRDLFQLEVSIDQGEWTPAEHVFPYHEIGTSKYGMRLIHAGGDAEVRVEFGGNGAEDGTDWTAAPETGGYTRWRVTRVTSANTTNPPSPLPTRDQSTGNQQVGSGFTLYYPNLEIVASDDYTVNGRLHVDNELLVNGDLIVPSGGEVFVEDTDNNSIGTSQLADYEEASGNFVDGSSNIDWKATRLGSLISVTFNVLSINTATDVASSAVGELPASFRPVKPLNVWHGFDVNSSTVIKMTIREDGELELLSRSAADLSTSSNFSGATDNNAYTISYSI